jgi:hypothetical protein
MENTLRMSTSLNVLLPHATMKQQLEEKERK